MVRPWIFAIILYSQYTFSQKINRKPIVQRNIPTIYHADSLASFSLGNGRFAFTADITGLQTFPDYYQKGIPLGTWSNWGWYSKPNDKNYSIEQSFLYKDFHGRKIPYAVQWPVGTLASAAAEYFRQNPSRMPLIQIGWLIEKSNGELMDMNDIKSACQTLDIWNGCLNSAFEIESNPVEIQSLVDQRKDLITVKIKSKLVREGKIKIRISYPYPTSEWLDEGNHFDANEQSRLSIMRLNDQSFTIYRNLGIQKYYSHFHSDRALSNIERTPHGYILEIPKQDDHWSFAIEFNQKKSFPFIYDFNKLKSDIANDYHQFWIRGGIIDFSQVPDSRARELERRMILSRYLMHVNCSGDVPPQETGLVYNSWFGRPHLEMSWWHGVNQAQWGNLEVTHHWLDWYHHHQSTAKAIAQRQGFQGIRWQKMTDPFGGESGSSVGSFLIWQQPHPIYLAEQLYISGVHSVLNRYAAMIRETADFMADFIQYDSKNKNYSLGPTIIPAQERFDPDSTYNPIFELAYWRYGLETAQLWNERLHKPREKKWDDILHHMASLPVQDSNYLANQFTSDSYTNPARMTDHPAVLMSYGILPKTAGIDENSINRTFDIVWNRWHWQETWGWDFPVVAMTAARLHRPEKAIDALLMPIKTNTYLVNGYNYQNDRLRLYLPGNGAFLTALGMMATGWKDSKVKQHGFPKEWKIKYEGINQLQ